MAGVFGGHLQQRGILLIQHLRLDLDDRAQQRQFRTVDQDVVDGRLGQVLVEQIRAERTRQESLGISHDRLSR